MSGMAFILSKASFPEIITSSGIDVCKNDKNYNDGDFCFPLSDAT